MMPRASHGLGVTDELREAVVGMGTFEEVPVGSVKFRRLPMKLQAIDEIPKLIYAVSMWSTPCVGDC